MLTAGWSRVAGSHADSPQPPLGPGIVLGGRYEVLQFLAQGGMGAVYKARDMELDRVVAVKVIRPEFASDPNTLQRFKHELILARQITHRNVIRIFDLGTHESTKFITMEFVEGHDLSALLEERKFTAKEAALIVRQVSRALEAAHAENVVHRDLKPQNIMIDGSGEVRVMDFGLARSVEMSGLTQAGAVLGTPAYMSPEQARGVPVDERSDLFSLGIIFYELLTGVVPYRADTVWASLLKRTQELPPPPASVAPEVPQELSDLVMRCLAIKPEERCQSATELTLSLEMWLGETVMRTALQAAGGSPSAPAPVDAPAASPAPEPEPKPRKPRMAAVAGGLALLLLGGALAWWKLVPTAKAPPKIATVVIADFSNHTGDAIFDGTLEPMLQRGLEGAGFISAYNRTTIPVKLESPRFDEAAALRVAVGQGLGVVVSGSLDRQGAGFTLSAKVIQAVTGSTIASIDASASNKDQVLFAVTKLAIAVRKALGDDTSESSQRFAMETLTATSIEAIHEYAAGMESLSSGKFDEARRSFSKATDLDPNFGLAYAGMASASRSLGESEEAVKYIRQAIAKIDPMTERERYRTRGIFYVLTGDQQKCVEEYSALITRFASDVGAHNNLGVCYSYLRNVPKAIEEMQRASNILPKRAVYRFNLALYRAYAGDFAGAEKEVRAAQQLNPAYEKGFLTLAYTQLGQGQMSQAAETYQRLEKLSPSGASLAASGLADLAVYEGRFGDAARILEKAASEESAAKKSEAAANKYVALARVELLRGRKASALAAVESALKNSQAMNIRFLAARVLVEAGSLAKARELAAGLSAELKAEPQSYGKLIEAAAAVKEGNARQAISLATAAKSLFDTWISRFDLGRAYLEAGAFTEADSEFDQCSRRRGEAMELFMDDIATYGYFPPVYYWLGRVREGMKSTGFAESYRTYIGIRGKAGEDPLLADARRRAGQ